MTTTSQAIRKSPSGPLSDVQLPIYGTNLVTTASTHYLQVGSFGDSATENVGQVAIPEAGVLRKFIAQNVVVGGTASFAITYNIRKNGTLIAGATVATTNEAADPVEIDINEPVHGPISAADAESFGFPAGVAVAADLISVEIVVAAFGGGTSPTIRTELLWTPGATS